VKTYTFLIGTHDDFETLDELLNWFENGTVSANGWGAVGRTTPNASAFEFEAPAGLDRDLLVYIGRGIAFSNDWCMDDTFSTMIEGSLDKTESGQMSDEDDSRDYAAPV